MIFSVPCLFGLEGLVGTELRRLGMDGVTVENGRVLFEGDFSAMARANLNLRTGERVLLRLARFPATSFEMLFDAVRTLPLADLIPADGAFPVKGHCLNSQLHSVPDCQRIIKKAASVNLGEHYHQRWMPETGETYQLQFSIMKDVAELYLDTTGPGLHKRGYRAVGNDAPLRETLAAAMVELARYRGREVFLDPFCGSGTICIEAALIAANRAPGMGRNFAAQKWRCISPEIWQQARSEAIDREFHGEYHIYGSDCDARSLQIAAANAKKAGMAHYITYTQADATTRPLPAEQGILVTNPPYGQRLMEQRSAQQLYRQLGRHLQGTDGWRKYIITSEPEFEHYFGRRADKKRKLYNGMIKCDLYQYL
jgi:putative N6-adenine-specific DNA methylase